MPAIVRDLARRLFANPWLLLSLTCLFWAGNIVAARTAIDNISPMALVTGRWAIPCTILFFTTRKALVADWPALKPHWPRLAMMAVFGYTGYNTLYYLSAHYTQGVNLSILQGATPVYVFLGAWLLWRTPVSLWQMLGCGLTIIGILFIGTQGDLSALSSLRFNIGDIGILLASLFYSIYTLALRNRPKASAFGFFFGLAIAVWPNWPD